MACQTIQAAMWPIGRKAVAIHKSRYPSPTTVAPVCPALPSGEVRLITANNTY